MRRLALAALVGLLLAGCGQSAEDKRRESGERYCQHLQDRDVLIEPMSQCLREFEQATREPEPPIP